MLLSIFLAKFFGLYLAISCFSLLLKFKKVQQVISKWDDQLGLFYFSGLINLFIGLFFVLIHSVWTLDWRLIVTLMGYLILLKGLIRLFFAEKAFQKCVSLFKENPQRIKIITAVFLVIGLYLIYIGFWVY
jgi:hypothetical protein